MFWPEKSGRAQWPIWLDLVYQRVLTMFCSFPQMNPKVLLLLRLLCVSQLFGPLLQPSVVSHIPHAPVTSTGIAAIGYSKRRHILEIESVNGAIYRYIQVAPDVYRELMNANSKARYYDTNVRGKYLSVRVRPRRKR